MKAGTTEKLKFKKLQRRLKLKLWQCAGLLETLWMFTASNAPAGDIGRHSNEDIAAALEWEDDADDLVNALVEARWLDLSDEHRLLVHDWKEHCPNYLRGGFARSGRVFASEQLSCQKRTKKTSLATTSELPANPGSASTSEVVPTKSSQFNSSQVKPIQVKSSQVNPIGDDGQDSDSETDLDSEKPDPETLLAFPDELDTPEFREAWCGQWIRYQKTLSPHGREPPLVTQQAQLANLARYGPASAIVVIQTSIRHGWKGLFPERLENDTNGPRRKNARSNSARSGERSL